MTAEIDMNGKLRDGASDIFWGEIAPCEHLVQIYEDTGVFLDTLESFAAGGIKAGDSVIIIATAPHRNALESRLTASGIDMESVRAEDRYISVDAAEILSEFMREGWPDEELFNKTIKKLLGRARRNGRRVRAFGEMVAILWARGDQGATVRLEHLWQYLCNEETFSLFCAYPRTGFTQDADASIAEICSAHSRMIAG